MIRRLENPDAVAVAAAERLVEAAAAGVERSGRFVVVLAGGSTPRRLYGLLGEPAWRERIPWSKAVLLFSDERCVPPDDEQSNYRMVRETLIAPLGIADRQVHRMLGELKPEEAAVRYLLKMRDLFAGDVAPRVDLLLLGVGRDGHTASLFPGTKALAETRRWVAANFVPRLDAWRLTMTLVSLCAARRVLFLATGADKARVVAEAFGGVEHPEPHPAELVVPREGEREVLVDAEAAALLPD